MYNISIESQKTRDLIVRRFCGTSCCDPVRSTCLLLFEPVKFPRNSVLCTSLQCYKHIVKITKLSRNYTFRATATQKLCLRF
jgi:hypothetical protein